MHRSLRKRGGIRYTFWIEKMDMVGLVKRYKMMMYRGTTMTNRTKPERIEHGTYKEEVYLLYDSYAKGKGKEKIMDARQNVLNNKGKFKLIGVGVLVFAVVSFFMVRSLWGFFHPKAKESDNPLPVGQKVTAAAPLPTVPPSEYRAVGWYQIGGNRFVIIRGANGVDRSLVNPRGWSLDRTRFSGFLDGKPVADWTGDFSGQKLIK